MPMAETLTIRPYVVKDADTTWQLFYSTIRNINIRDYSLEQVQAWAPDNFNSAIWANKMQEIQPVVAELDGEIVGYTDLQPDGLIDHFFCHHLHQRKGVGRFMMDYNHDRAKMLKLKQLRSEVSITARPFYEYFGFTVVKEQHVKVRGQVLTNFCMTKDL